MSATVINMTTSWTPDKEDLEEAISESAAMITFVILSQRVALTIASAKGLIPITFAALQIHALLMTSSEVAEIMSVYRSEVKSAATRRVMTAKLTAITGPAPIEDIACQIHAEPMMIASMMIFTSALGQQRMSRMAEKASATLDLSCDHIVLLCLSVLIKSN